MCEDVELERFFAKMYSAIDGLTVVGENTKDIIRAGMYAAAQQAWREYNVGSSTIIKAGNASRSQQA